MYIATVGFGSCGGCHNSLLSAGEPLIAMLCEHTVAFSSHLVDSRSVSPCDVVIVTGCLLSSGDVQFAEEVSRMSRKVIALGSCAVYGGIPALSALSGGVSRRISGPKDLPPMLHSPEPVDSCMDVDYYIPGCPPPPNLVFEALKSILEGRSHARYDGTVCSECSRRVETKRVNKWSSHPGGGTEDGRCLLDSGHLCLGPVTRGGCKAACPEMGSICIGCRGPSDTVLSSQLHSLHSDMVKFVSNTAKLREATVEKNLKDLLKLSYLFTLCDPVMKNKAGERMPSCEGDSSHDR